MSDLAARQAALVAALVAGAAIPEGFDECRLRAASAALLRKRAAGVTATWPLLAAGCGADWPALFTGWAAGRRPNGALRDGWDFARSLRALGRLPELGAVELASREALTRYDGHQPPRPRRLPALRRIGGVTVLGFAGRAYPLARWRR